MQGREHALYGNSFSKTRAMMDRFNLLFLFTRMPMQVIIDRNSKTSPTIYPKCHKDKSPDPASAIWTSPQARNRGIRPLQLQVSTAYAPALPRRFGVAALRQTCLATAL